MSPKAAACVGIFLASSAQASICNIAVLEQSGRLSDTASATIDLTAPTFSLATPSNAYKAEVHQVFIEEREYRNVVILSQSNKNHAAALFLANNDHPFLSMTADDGSGAVVVQFQCWLELDSTR